MAIGARSSVIRSWLAAIFDRLLHHSTMINIHGDSYRPDGWPVFEGGSGRRPNYPYHSTET